MKVSFSDKHLPVLNPLLKKVFRMYVIVSIIAFTIFLLLMLHVTLHELFDYIELPNGAKLVKHHTSSFFEPIALLSPNGREVVAPSVMEIVWNDHYIAGSVLREKSHYFIYEIGTTTAEIYPAIGVSIQGNYHNKLKQIGLSEKKDQTFWGLWKENVELRRSWYE